jgi:hypothetical protein
MEHTNKRARKMEATDSLTFLYIALDCGLKNGQLKDAVKLISTKVRTRSCK